MNDRKAAHTPKILEAMADASRRAMMERLARRAMAVGELADGLPISRPAVSQHLKILHQAGLIQERREGTRRLYAANPKALADLRQYVDGLWEQAFRSVQAQGAKKRGPQTP